MLLTVNSKQGKIDWCAKGNARVAQNVLNLINTMRYEVAYNRTLGIPPDVFDKPTEDAIAHLQAKAMELVSRYEPRAMLKNIVCTPDEAGNIVIEVVIEV